MPITITDPPTSGVFGPGFHFQVSSNFVGPVVNPSFEIDILTTNLEGYAHQMQVPLSATPYAASGQYLSTTTVTLPSPLIKNGDAAVLRVQLVGNSGVVEELDRPISFDGVQGALYQLFQNLLQQSSSGFSATDRANLATVKTQTMVSFPGIAGFGLGDIARFLGPFSHPPLGFIHRVLIGDYDTAAALTRPAPGIGVNAFGLAWEVVSYGGGIGLDPGAPLRFDVPIMTVDLEHTDSAGHDFVSATYLADFSNYYWFFDPAVPTRVNVYPTPSYTVRLYWLVAP